MDFKKVLAGPGLVGMCGGVYAMEEAIVVDGALKDVKGLKPKLLSEKIPGINLKNVHLVDGKTYFDFDVPESKKLYQQWLTELHSSHGCKIKFENFTTHASKILTLHVNSSTATRSPGKTSMLGSTPVGPIHATYKWGK